MTPETCAALGPRIAWQAGALARRSHRLATVVSREDLVQEGYLAALCAAPRFDNSRGARLSTFLSQRIGGGMMDALRRADLVPRTAQEQYRALGVPPAVRMPAGTGGVTPADADRLLLVAELLERLPPRERGIVKAIYWGGRSARELAVALGVSAGRISQLHHRALARLRSLAS